MTLVAIHDLRYAGRDLKAGDAFDVVSPKDAEILKGVGKAKDAPAESAADLLRTGDDQDINAGHEVTRRAPRYNRRDMRAKD